MKRGGDFGGGPRGGGGGGGPRGGGGGGGGRFNGDFAKRFRNDDPSKLEVRILIPTRIAGRIIGKGGENVKRLRSEFKANVTIPDSTAPERVVHISGDLDNIADVAKDVISKMEESRAKDDTDDRNIELKVLVHKGQAGAVIGKGGARIKEIREKTKTNVKVFPEPCPASTDRVTVIAGSPDQMAEALKEVVKSYLEISVRGPQTPYDTNNYDGNNVNAYGGYPPDRNWRGPMPPGPGMGAPPMSMGGMGQQRQPYGGASGGMGMPPQHMGGGAPGFGSGRQYMGNGSSGMGMPGGGGGGGHPGGMGMNYGNVPNPGMPMPGMPMPGMPMPPAGHGERQTSQVTIPKELAGTIIGRSGERLKSIKEQSGAYIVVEPLEQGANDRIISITGTSQNIQMAQYLLQQTVRSSQFGDRFQ